MKPRTLRELEALPQEEATKIWESLSNEEKLKLANAMTSEEIAAMPQYHRETLRNMTAETLERALNELEAAQTSDGKFVFTGEGEPFELDEAYCIRRLADLTQKFEGETEESIGFYAYHNLRLWIEAYRVLLNEQKKGGK
jgi:hypothetical protein